MKKLAETRIDEDKFGPFLREEELREELKAILRQTNFDAPFPRKVLQEMSLLEVASLFTCATSRKDASSKPALCLWIHKHISPLVLTYFELNRLAKRTTDVLPVDWYQLHISDLIAAGGRFNTPVTAPDGEPGIMHTIPRFSLKIVLSGGRTQLWYETA